MTSTELKSLIPDYVLELLNEIGAQEGFINFNVDLSSGTKPIHGFFGIISRITIKGLKNGQNYELHLMVKMLSNSTAGRQQFNLGPAFEREIYMYTVVIPAFVKFQQTYGLNTENGFYAFPKCYGTISDNTNNKYAVVLDDLSVSGYELWNKHTAVDIDHLKLVMEKLGTFHAISFAMKEKNPQVFAQFEDMRNNVIDQIETNPETLIPMFNSILNDAIAAFDFSENKAIEKMENFKLELINILKECFSKTLAAPFNVINHGDLWSNNILYLYNKSKNPQDVSIIAWNSSRYCSPATDIVCLLFTSTDKTFRDAQYENILKIYHNKLAETLNYLGCDVDQLFTFNDLKNQLKLFGKYALIASPMLLKMITANIKDTSDIHVNKSAAGLPKLEGSVLPNLNEYKEMIYKQRVTEVIKDIIALGYY